MAEEKKELTVLRKTPVAGDRFARFERWKIQLGQDVLDYWMVVESHYVLVLGITSEGEVVLIKETKPASGMQIQCVAGSIKADETPEQAGKREFEEESGYKVGRIISLGQFFQNTARAVAPDGSCKTMFAFLAKDLEEGPQNLEVGENIRVCLLPLDQAVSMVGKEIRDLGTSLVLLLARRGEVGNES